MNRINFRLVRVEVIVVGVFLFWASLVFAAEIDSSLYTGNNKQLINRYEKLLSSLKTPQNTDYDTQRTILYTLINILKNSDVSFLDFKTVKVKSQYDYMLLFRKVAKIHLNYDGIDNRIENIRRKLKILKETINALSDNSTHLMTYQLQYAFYTITLKRLTTEKQIIEKNLKRWDDALYKMFLKVKFYKKAPQKRIQLDLERYNRLNKEIEKLNIEKDRLELLGKSKKIKNISARLNNVIKSKDATVLDIINNYILIDMYLLKHSKKTMDVEKEIKNWIKKLAIDKNILLAKEESVLLFYIKKRKIGAFKAFLKEAEGNISQMAEITWHFIRKPLFRVGGVRTSIFDIVLAIFIFVLGVYVGNIYKKHIKTSNLGKNFTLSTRTILGNVGYYAIVLITFFISLRIIGVNLSSLTVILGALSVGVGFGLQNMVSNLISGIILMLENSIRVGDYIEVSDNLRGTVKDIQIRSTTIITNDNIEVIIPNQTLFQNNVINWTLTEKVRRFRIPFGVAYGTDVDKVKRVVLDALEKSGINYIKDVPGKTPEIRMIAMSSSSIDFNLDVWVEGDDVIYPRRTTSKFLIMIYKALNENGITIPFPQLDIHVKEPIVVTKKNENK